MPNPPSHIRLSAASSDSNLAPSHEPRFPLLDREEKPTSLLARPMALVNTAAKAGLPDRPGWNGASGLTSERPQKRKFDYGKPSTSGSEAPLTKRRTLPGDVVQMGPGRDTTTDTRSAYPNGEAKSKPNADLKFGILAPATNHSNVLTFPGNNAIRTTSQPAPSANTNQHTDVLPKQPILPRHSTTSHPLPTKPAFLSSVNASSEQRSAEPSAGATGACEEGEIEDAGSVIIIQVEHLKAIRRDFSRLQVENSRLKETNDRMASQLLLFRNKGSQKEDDKASPEWGSEQPTGGSKDPKDIAREANCENGVISTTRALSSIHIVDEALAQKGTRPKDGKGQEWEPGCSGQEESPAFEALKRALDAVERIVDEVVSGFDLPN